MEHITDHIYIDESSVYELLIMMYKVQYYNRLKHMNESNKTNDPEHLIKFFNDVISNVPEEILNELEVFFNNDSFFGLSLIPVAFRNKIYKDLESFFAFIKDQLSPYELVSYFFNNGYKEADYNSDEIMELILEKKTFNLVKQMSIPELEKWKLFYLVEDAKNTKERFMNLLHVFHQTYYKQFIKMTKEKQNDSILYFKSEVQTKGIELIEALLKINYEQLKSIERILFIPSYFQGLNITTSDISGQTFIALYGIDMPSEIVMKDDENDLIDALKSISDEKRVRIIQFLKAGPKYGYEVGQELNLSNSTISHHLGMLIKHNIITAIREQNKIYYTVNNTEITLLLDKINKYLTE